MRCHRVHFYSKSSDPTASIIDYTVPSQQQLKLIGGRYVFETSFRVLLPYCPGCILAGAFCGGSLVQILRCHAPVTKLTKGRTNVISSDHYDRCFLMTAAAERGLQHVLSADERYSVLVCAISRITRAWRCLVVISGVLMKD